MTNNTKKEIKETYSFTYSDKFDFEDLENRRIYINCDISEIILDTAVYHILRYNRLDKDTPIEQRKPIILYINTPGGSRYRWICFDRYNQEFKDTCLHCESWNLLFNGVFNLYCRQEKIQYAECDFPLP